MGGEGTGLPEHSAHEGALSLRPGHVGSCHVTSLTIVVTVAPTPVLSAHKYFAPRTVLLQMEATLTLPCFFRDGGGQPRSKGPDVLEAPEVCSPWHVELEREVPPVSTSRLGTGRLLSPKQDS